MLEIRPTVDQKIIKLAYAKKLHRHHPEDDPEGFKRLRKAYEEALKTSKTFEVSEKIKEAVDQFSSKSSADESETQTNHSDTMEKTEESSSTQQKEMLIDVQKVAESIMEQVAAIYADFNKRQDPKLWMGLLSSDALWNIEVKQRLAFWIFQFVSKHPFLSNEVYQLIAKHFSWFDNHSALSEAFGGELSDSVLRRIHQAPWSLSYKVLEFPGEWDQAAIDQYLHRREGLEFYVMHNDQEKVEEYVGLMEQDRIVDPECIRLLTFYHLNNQRAEQALLYCDRAIEQCDTSVDAQLERARICFGKGDYFKAAKAYQEVLSIDEHHGIALRGLAACYFENNNIDEAISLYEQALNAVEFDMEARIQLIRIKQVTIKSGLEELEKNAKDKFYIYQVAQAQYDIGAYREAEESLRRIEIPKLNYDMVLLLAKVFEKVHYADQAIQVYEVALEKAKIESLNGFEAKVNLGKLHSEAQCYDQAIQYLEEALKFDPENHEILGEAANCYRYQSDHETAFRLINQAISFEDSSWWYFSIRAYALIGLKKHRAAISDFNRSLEGNHINTYSYYGKGICLIELGNHERAVETLQRAIDCKQDYAQAYYHQSKSYFELGEKDKAIKALHFFEKYGGDEEDAERQRKIYNEN